MSKTEKMVNELETIKSEINMAKGVKKQLEEELRRDFQISRKGIKKKMSQLKKERASAEKALNKAIKKLRIEWKNVFGEESSCPV